MPPPMLITVGTKRRLLRYPSLPPFPGQLGRWVGREGGQAPAPVVVVSKQPSQQHLLVAINIAWGIPHMYVLCTFVENGYGSSSTSALLYTLYLY